VLPWSSIHRDTPGDLILLRSTWDYHKRVQEFRNWLAELEATGRRVLNPVSTVRWNLDKAYLSDLAALGIAIPETRFEYQLTPPRLAALMASLGWSHAVVKPRISATAYGTFLVRAGDMVDSLAPAWESGALVQEYVSELTQQGELSLMFFGGEYSHAVIKRPRPGDFRVQTDFGGSVEPILPSEDAIQFGTRVLHRIPHPGTYARVDIVETAKGPLLMELELIEPHLFFDVEPRSAERLADLLSPTV
jgi:glutathione synthase/RimK-type ligase-like ATP-grasp enzyme